MFNSIALLIDADNIGGQKVDWIFDKINTLGTITTKRIYGDFAKPHLSSWESYILKHAIIKKHQTSYSTGKNSSDIALAIDAIDLLHTNEHDAFCIISSDSDFIGLALRLRQSNIAVFGFGENKTIKEFRQVCSEFFEIPNNQANHTQQKSKSRKYTANELKGDTKLLNALRDSVNNNKPDKDGWVNYAIFASYFQKTYPNINAQHYGYDKLYEMLDNIDIFEGKKENATIFIRIKPNKHTQTPNNPQQYSSEKLTADNELITAIKDGIAKNLENGWANFSPFIQYLNTHYPNIKPSDYGYGKWRALINQIKLFETKQINTTTLFIREKSPNSNKINNPELLNDILGIINNNTVRTDEWVHIGSLGSQLKQQGYDPKSFGFKTITLLLRNTVGVENKIIGSTDYFTLSDKSKIKPITATVDFSTTSLYQIFMRNKDKINAKIQELLARNIELSTSDFWRILVKSLPNELLLENNQSYDCFMQFAQNQLTELKLTPKADKMIFTLNEPTSKF